MGRPKVEVDESLIERLAFIHCNNTEIAAAVGCSVDTLDRRFAELIAKAREKGKSSLRRLQWETAQKGNVTMQIWLGKQILGQREPEALNSMTNGNIKITVEDFTTKK